MFIYPYKTGSASAKLLSEALGAKRIRREGSRFRGNPEKVVINWGCSELPEEVMNCKVINPPEITNIASNKLKFFKAITEFCNKTYSHIPLPPYTSSKEEAQSWLDGDNTIVVRHKLTGNSGEGIEIVDPEDGATLPDAPLYVLYIKKKQEYRVHVAKGEVVDIQRKARRTDVPDDQIDWRIRNHDNGFIFARNDLQVPRSVGEAAKRACTALNLDFGAVDVIWNDRQGTPYVLEVNTAPGLSGTTLEGYVERFKSWEFEEETPEIPQPMTISLDEMLQRNENGLRADARRIRDITFE